MTTLECVGLKYAYDKKTSVLKGVNATFEAEKMYAILGPSGCGKTTLLSLIGGLDEPTGGEIKLNGESINKNGLAYHRRHNVAFIFQSYNLIDYLTPFENVSLTSPLPPLPILEKVGLSGNEAGRNVLKLSGGQQQRVAIARALASDASILLADEPTGNLDEETAANIAALLKESAHYHKKCVIVVTHSAELAREADVVYGIKKGVLQNVEDFENGKRGKNKN
ncbi:MAG: ABC transporter ATP-binding protein [Oscillospiraceae bacterium]|jgi:putative ABC transport system ATP-binding protein|nr:ABC transporter ATP-binding protein [Oscillospiraceae bacterium]